MYSNKFIRKAKFFLGCFIFFLTISFSVYSQYNESDYEKVATTIKVFRVNGGVRTEVTNLSSTSSSPVVLRTGDIIQFNLTQNGYYKYNYKVTTTGGVPRIHLVSTDIIPRDFYANYVSGHGTKSLVFEYVVSESDRSNGFSLKYLNAFKSATDADRLNTPLTLELNGGTIFVETVNLPRSCWSQRNYGYVYDNLGTKIDYCNIDWWTGKYITVAQIYVDSDAVNAGQIYGPGESFNVDYHSLNDLTVNNLAATLTLDIGGTIVTGNYSGMPDSKTLRFNFTVPANLYAEDINYTATDAIQITSGTVKYSDATNADLTLPTLNSANSLKGTENIRISPTGGEFVTKVALNGYYNSSGQILNIPGATAVATGDSRYYQMYLDVYFSSSVTITGTPRLELNLNTPSTDHRYATYLQSSGNKVTFTYVNTAFDYVPYTDDLDYLASNSLTLNGGTIKNGTVNAILNLPTPGTPNSLSGTSNIVFDNARPTVVKFKTSFTGTAKAGDIVPITVQFSEPVFIHVPGDDYILKDYNGNVLTRWLNPSVQNGTGDGTSEHTFYYKIPTGSSGTFKVNRYDISGTKATNFMSEATDRTGSYNIDSRTSCQISDQPTYYVACDDAHRAIITYDGVLPTFTTLTIASNNGNSSATAKAGDVVTFSMTTSESLTAPTITIAGSTYTATGSGTSWTLPYTVANNVSSGTLTYTVNITDLAGNSKTYTTTTNSSSIIIDNVSPSVSSVAVPTNATYKGGEVLTFKVNTSENVYVTGSPSIPLTVGSSVVQATYVAGSGTNSITFSYSVVNGDIDANGVAVASSISLNTGAITDQVGNSLNLTLNSVASTSGVLVDAVLPIVSSISRVTNVNTNAAYVDFTVTFNKAVTGVDVSDFTLTYTGNISSGTVSSVSGSGNIYTVRVRSYTGDGTIGLNLNLGTTNILDVLNNEITAGFSSGQTYTIDQTLPTLSEVTISSSNTNSAYAKVGDIITVSFTSSESINAPTVTISGQSATVSGTGNTFTANYTVTSSTTVGTATFSVSFSDISGNAGTAVTASTNSSTVNIDRTAPTLSFVAISSNNSSTNKAKEGDIITLTISANEAIQTPIVTIAGSSASITGSGSTYTATYTVTNSTPSGTATFSISFSDLASNAGTAVTTVTNGTSVVVDRTAPSLTLVKIASNNSNTTLAKAGNIISLSLTASESITSPTVTIAGQSATVTGTAGTYTATYTVLSSTQTGTVGFTVNFSDLTGNAGTQVVAATNTSTVVVDTESPNLTFVSIASNNASPNLAKATNVISLSITASEAISTPTVTILGMTASVSGSGSTYTATYTVLSTSVEGSAAISITYSDLTGNAGTVVTSTTNNSAVTVDRSSPTVISAAILSNNATTSKAKDGDVISISLTTSEPVNLPTATISGQSVTVTGTSGNYTATYTVTNTTPSGVATFTFNFTDLAGNSGTATSTTNSSLVTIDRTAPTISNLSIVSNNASTTKAKIGNIISVSLTSSEPIFSPTVTIAGQTATVTGTSSTYTATYTVTSATPQGTASISVSYSDLAGNAGTVATSTTNSSSILIDYTAPTSYAISINQAGITQANQSATSVNLTGAEVGAAYNYSVSIASSTITGTGTITNTSQTISNINVSSLPDGILTYSVSLTDATGNQGSAITQTVSKDALPPTVSSVTTTVSNGNYKAGDVIPVVVNFTEPVNVTGTPQITLITGTSSATTAVNYSSGSGTTSLTFNYTIGSNNTSSDLNYAATTSLSLNGGTIIDAGNNIATLTLPATNSSNSLAGSSNIVIDTQVPTVSSLTISSNNTNSSKAKIGDIVTVVLTASEPIQTPTITIAGQSATATGTSSTYTATYTVSNTTPQGTASISVSYSDLAGNAGTVATNTTNSSSVLIDYTAPSGYAAAINQSSITVANQSATSVNLTGAEVGTTYNFSVSIASSTITGTGTITNTSQTISNINVSSLPDGILTYSVSLTDAAGNQGLAITQTVSKDALPPTISSVTTTASNGNYKAGDFIPVVVNFTEPVNVTGTPQITLITGTSSATTAVNYSSGSGTTSLTFNYTIGSNNTSSDLNYAATTSLSLNGGTIIDAGNNIATLTLPATNSSNSLAGSANIVIDTQVPTVSSVTISSNNTNSSKAKIGDIVTVVLTSSEPIQIPTVTIAGQSATVTGTTSTYTATYTVTNSTPQGTASISVSYSDIAGNNGVQATTTSNASLVVIDITAPVLNTVTVSSNNANPATAKVGDVVTVLVSSSEPINTPVITIASNTISVVANTSSSFTGTYTITNNTNQGSSINITYSDLTGNIGTVVTSTTNSSTISIDKTAPLLNTVVESSNNVNSTKAKVGDVITVALTANEPIQTPIVTIAGQSASVTGTSSTYSASYTVTSNTTEGAAAILISYSDIAGNAGAQVSSTTNSSTVMVDRTAPSTFTIAWIPNNINNQNFRSVGFTLTNVEVGASYIYTISSGTSSITSTGTVTSTSQSITGIDSYAVRDGVVTLSVKLKDGAGNETTPVTANINKATNAAPTGTVLPITISQNDPNRLINLVQGLTDPDNDPLTVNSLSITYSLVNISNSQSLPISSTRQTQFEDVVSTSDLSGNNLSIETLKSKFLPANQKGVISISYIVTDGFNSVNESTQLEIIGANDQPTGNNVTINQVTVNGSNALVPLIEGLGVSSAVPGIDPDADSIQYVLDPTSNVANGQFQFQNDGSFVFVPDNDYFGEQEFKYFVKDQTGVEQGPYIVKIVIRENPDIDGVPSVLEMLGADGGDVNGDGVPDRKQNNITTFPITSFADFQAGLAWASDSTKPKPPASNVGSLLIGYIPADIANLKDTSLKMDPFAKFSNVALDPKPSTIDTTSAVKGFATDVYSFQVEPMFGRQLTDLDGDASNGKQTRVILNFPRGIKATTYLKKNKSGQWFSFLDDQKLETWDEGATLINLDNDSSTIERIILTLKDGGLGDYDGLVNDTIVDPGALGEMNPLIRGVNLGAFNEGRATNTLLHDINDANSGKDEDAEGQSLFYLFAPNTDSLITKAISLDSLTGKLTVKNKDDFDFEVFEKNGKAIVQFDVIAKDATNNSAQAKFTIEILNIDEYPKILNGRSLQFTEKDTVSIPVVQIKALPDYQDITTFEILNELDATSFNINNNTGIVKFNISPIYKVKKLYQFAIKALDNLGHTDTAHFDVNIIPLPPPPVIGDTAIYKLDAINAPITFTNLVSKPADGSEIRWRFAETSANNWVDTIPRMPDSVGRYNYIIKTFDPITGLFSKDSSIVNIVIRPYDPIVKDSTYIIGAKNNPTNISIQVKGMPRNTFNFYSVDSTLLKSSSNNGIKSYQYNVSAISTTAPSLPNVPGKFKYAVNQIVNTVESDTLPFIVNMIEQRDIVQVYYKIDTPILLANSTFNVPMEVIITNKLSKPIDSVQVQTIVKDMMPVGSEFKVVSLESTGNIKVDTKFDGVSNVNLIAPNVIAPPLSVDTVKLIVNIIPNGFTGTLKNSVTLTGKSVYGWVDVKSSKTIDGSTTEMTPVFIPEVFLKIPEIYTPNRDGINDNFVIVRPYGMKIELEVFNRWGSVVYTNSDYQNEWDGKGSGSFLGQDLVDGGYYYKIRTRNTKGETQLFNGYVVIQR